MNLPFANLLLRLYVAHRSRRVPVAPLDSFTLSQVQRVLLVLTTGLGDAVLSTPVFPNLRRALPHADIRLFCRAPWTGLFERDPDLNGVIPYHGKYRRFFATIRELGDFGPDLTVVLHGNDPDVIPLAYLAGSRFIVRIPVAGTRYPFLLSNRDRSQDAATVPGRHYVENRLRVLDTLGVPTTDHTPRIVLSEEAMARFRDRAAARIGSRLYWVFHPLSADWYKVWPLDKARDFLKKMLETRPGRTVVLTGGPRERKTVASLASGLPPDRVVNLCGELDLCETAACLKLAQCVVAPDTGILHLAAAMDVPTIGLYAATLPSHVGNRSRNAPAIQVVRPQPCRPCLGKRCPYLPRNCMDQIPVAEVVETVDRYLSRA